jgi:regulator of protease activity HflC (stomatin/prohibitin superfamily)
MASTSRRKLSSPSGVLSPSFSLLGAGFLFSHEAAAITRGNSFSRADGPGLIFLQPGETIAQIFDLRTHSRRMTVQATTRDGIPVETSVSVSFHVRRRPPGQRRPRSVESDDIPYPYDRAALFDLTYAGSVGGDNDAAGWTEQICPSAATLLVREIGRFTLDQLLVSGGAEPLSEIRANIKRDLEAQQTSDDGPTLPKGVTIAGVGVGGLKLPDDVVTKRLATWQVEWQKRESKALADAAIETQRRVNQARAHALADSIEGLLASIDNMQATSQTQLHEVILSQLAETLEALAASQALGGLPQQSQWLSLADDTSREMRRYLEGEE